MKPGAVQVSLDDRCRRQSCRAEIGYPCPYIELCYSTELHIAERWNDVATEVTLVSHPRSQPQVGCGAPHSVTHSERRISSASWIDPFTTIVCLALARARAVLAVRSSLWCCG